MKNERFIPFYDQPVTMESLNQLEPSLLADEVARLQNSIQHLETTQNELNEFLNGDQDGEELDEETKNVFIESIEENKVTISRQQERMTMIRLAMQNQLGVDAANSHYDTAVTSTINSRTSAVNGIEDEVVVQPGSNRIEVETTTEGIELSEAVADDGMYL